MRPHPASRQRSYLQLHGAMPAPYSVFHRLVVSVSCSHVGTDLRAVRPRGAGPVVLSVESACPGEWRFFVMFAGAALSEKSPYLGSAWVRLSLW